MQPKVKIERLSFADGIISDSSQVATPEGVVLRACNFDVQSNGAAHLRPPLRRESSSLPLFAGAATGQQYATVWDSPDGDTTKQFVIVQVGSKFKVLSRARTVASAVTDVTPSTADHAGGTITQVSVLGPLDGAKIHAATHGKYCVITGLEMESSSHYFQEAVLILEYRRELGTLTAWFDLVTSRDFFGIEDGRTNGERVTSSDATPEVVYNLFNQGWYSEVTGTAPTKYVIRDYYANAGWYDADAVHLLSNVASTSYISLALDGAQVVGGVWTPLGVPSRVHVTLFSAAGCTFYLEVTGTTDAGVTGVYVYTYTAPASATYINNTTDKFSRITSVRAKVSANSCSVTLGSPQLLPGDYDNWTLGLYLPTATTRGFVTNFLTQAPASGSKSPTGHYVVPLNWRSLNIGNKQGRGEFNGHAERVFSDWGFIASFASDRSGRPGKACSFSGRQWYSFTRDSCDVSLENTNSRSPDVSSIIAFSRVIDTVADIARCYQKNDPTDPEFNTILPDDGGFVRLRGTGEVRGLVPLSKGVLVVAERGVWLISGNTDDGFRADAYAVHKLSEVSCVSDDSVVSVGSHCVFAGSYGLYMAGPSENGMAVQSLTDGKNAKMYRELSSPSSCKAAYDSAYNKVHFLFSGTSEWVLDTVNGSIVTRTFVPGSYTILGMCTYPSGRVASLGSVKCPNYGYIMGNGTNVYLGYVRYDDTHGASYSWADEGGSYASSSELFIGHISAGDLQYKKHVPYLDVFLERTEYQYVISSGNVTLSHESSCNVSAFWEWADTTTSQYHTQSFEAYRYRRPFIPTQTADGTYTFAYGQEVLWTSNRLRGAGKTLAIKVAPSASKDCKFLGWCLKMGASQ